MAPSPLRQLAYHENSPILDPEADPEGWHTVPSTWVKGNVFGKRSVSIHCTGADGQALALLSSPNAVVLRLRRRVKYRDNNLTTKLEVGIDAKDTITDSESAVWWPSKEGATTMDSPRRCLAGEIHLNKILKPTTAIANFSIEHSGFPAFRRYSTSIDYLVIMQLGDSGELFAPDNYRPNLRARMPSWTTHNWVSPCKLGEMSGDAASIYPCLTLGAMYLSFSLPISPYFTPSLPLSFIMSEVTVAPPQYRRFSSVRLGQAPTTMTTQASPADLPPYSRRRRDTVSQMPRREPVAHTYQLVSGSKAWAVWKVVSSAKSSKSLPTFYEKETITGTLSLDVDRFESIQAIYVTVSTNTSDADEQAITGIDFQVTGRIITGAGSSDSYTFLNTSVPIWSKVAAGAKLQGSSTWPFSVPLPKTVSIPTSSGGSKLCPLPETFMERGMMASIQYDLTLRIARGKLRADSTLTTPFGYVPSSKPESPSMLRQLAYEEGCPTIPGPDVDPEGWRILPTVPVAGTLFNSRQLEARCNIAIAKPVCTTSRGALHSLILLSPS
ncbi:Pkinase-domain-containing protein [Salix suchowensis]|nr:Pkinase-domain-containing protein [Salix suchowensis]